MGHYASEMGYQTPAERYKEEMRSRDEAREEFANNINTFHKGDNVWFAGFAWRLLGEHYTIGFPLLARLTGMIVKRVKVIGEDGEKVNYISFFTKKEYTKYEESAGWFKMREWYDSNYFVPFKCTLKKKKKSKP